MKTFTLLQLAAVASAFVIPDVQTANSLTLEKQNPSSHPFWDNIPKPEHVWQDLEEQFEKSLKSVKCAKHKFDDVVEYTHDTAVKYGEKFESAFAGDAWLETADLETDLIDGEHPPHHGPPHHPPGKRPHHPPHHGPANQTVYELISKSKYTTKLAKLIDEFPDLVDMLNSTKANFTVFAPTDKAFEKIPDHAPKPSKEFLKKLLTYHVSPGFYPAGRVLVTRTIPTALEAEAIGKVPQRLSTQIGLRGLTVNFYSRIVAVDIFGTNGVIHGIDSILLPPPRVIDIITSFPGEFSTLELALYKTGLFDAFNSTHTHSGGTLFAPSNFAFKRLGPRINAFLFSQYGQKYLKALILYHAVDNITLYSDAIYKSGDDAANNPHYGIPKGLYHIDLPTGLEDKHLSVDVARYGRFITIKINGFTNVAVLDGVAADGVIQVVPSVLIPPKAPGNSGTTGEELSVEELKERLTPFVEVGEDEDDYDFGFEQEL